MKIFFHLFILIWVFFSFLSPVWALDLWDIFEDNSPEIHYCDDEGECGLDEGIKELENLEDIVTDQKASEYFQNIVRYLLTFLTLVGVIYIIYAWFNILTGAGDEDKTKKSKTIIVFVIIGILIIYLAGPILEFILDILQTAQTSQ